MRCRLIAFAAMLAPAGAFADGPFGVSMGDDVAKLPACVADPKGHVGAYECKSLPKSHPAFESFVVFSSKETGACKVGAVGKDISDNGNGDHTRAKADEIAKQLAASYGPWSTKYDFLHAGALFKDDGYWLMALKEKERTYAYFWAPGKFGEKNDVKSIVLETGASSRDSGYVTLQFEFTNFWQCKAAMEKAEAAAF